MALKVVGGIMLVVALFVFVHVSLPHWKDNVAEAKAVATTTTSRLSNAAAVVLHDPTGISATITGTVVIDANNAPGGVPYIAYTDAQGHYATRQLIFNGVRGCAVKAGDLPCVSRGVNDAYPTLTAGETVTVQGTFEDTRFLVDSIQQAP